VAIEFMGPMIVAAIGGRTWRHMLFLVLAGIGVYVLARPGSGLNVSGALCAALAGAGWAAYTFSSHHLGAETSGFDGLAVAMCVSSLVTFPLVVHSIPTVTHTSSLVLRLFAMAFFATVLGFGAEMQALRRLRPSIVSILLAFDPVMALIVGLLVLGQHVHPLDLLGIAFVVAAGIGVTSDANGNELMTAG
jgi:inner membrane transporter RhtA